MIDGAIALATAGFVIAREHRNALQQRRFAGPVLPSDDGDGSIETQLESVPQKGQAKRIGIGVLDAIRVEPNPPQIRRAATGGPGSSWTPGSFPNPGKRKSPEKCSKTSSTRKRQNKRRTMARPPDPTPP